MEYVASISYGKDSLAMLEVIKTHNLPLDRIVHSEIWATDTIQADLPPVIEFKDKADKIILQRYGIKVERIRAKYTYEEFFYRVRGERAKKENQGKIYGFPITGGNWCQSQLKMQALNKLNKKDITQYIGIAVEEVNRYHNLSERKISPLVEYNITEKECHNWCERNNLLSPVYENTSRGGCWFCHNQSLPQLRFLRKNYPKYWELLLKWSNDSHKTFKANCTVQDLEKRFDLEDRQITLEELLKEIKYGI